MPYLSIQTNVSLETEKQTVLITHASKIVSEMLGKSESYVMVALQSNTPMSFAGSTAPTAYLELKSLGLPEQRTAEFSANLCQLIEQQLNIPAARIYIEFTNGQHNLWGWNNKTF